MKVFLLTLDPRMRAARPKPGSASMPTCRKRVCMACIRHKEASQKTQGKTKFLASKAAPWSKQVNRLEGHTGSISGATANMPPGRHDNAAGRWGARDLRLRLTVTGNLTIPWRGRSPGPPLRISSMMLAACSTARCLAISLGSCTERGRGHTGDDPGQRGSSTLSTVP
jgi:hypothetical protein